MGQISSWLAEPNVQLLHPGPRHLEIGFRLLREAGTAGNLTTDAQLVALAVEHDAVGRFRDLRWINPLA